MNSVKNELLMPAGSIEKMKYAYAYGADAVYLGLVDFSLRALRKGELIDETNLKTAVDIANKLNKKLYCTLNIFAYDKDIKKLYETLDIIKDAKPHALIISDFGIYNVIKNNLKDIDIHISTQTNTLNSEAVKFWRDMGASRVILARELSYNQIAEIRKNAPDIELEIFIHGAQCMGYSGRCLLSDYMTKGERQANQGNCAQACRWSYKLLEETRPNEYFEIIQDDKGSHIMSTKDLCLVNHIKKLCDLGIDSFKVEGRTKSLYYVSAAAKAYRMLIDGKIDSNTAFEELKKVGNRGYTEGFFMENNDSTSYSYDISKGLAGADFLGIVQKRINENEYEVLIKNKILLNDEIQIITPNYSAIAKVVKITHNKKGETDTANTNDIINLKFECDNNSWEKEFDFALLRTTGMKEF
ncbi:MAG: U32 family peptidase C-terminal domain-containing protein [Candidatus Gastranaerophilales bacterium]|nr:U32 family peptidase C-terminal domain-containing protein [Candidatus Gastranaerophilales bacterium]